MNRIMKRLCTCFLAVVMVVTFSVPAIAVDETKDSILMVQDTGHGEFKISQNMLEHSRESDNDTICLMPVSGRNGFYEDDDGKFYLKCTESSLLQVDEVPIDVSSIENVNQVIEEYGLSDVMANDLRNFCTNLSESRQVDLSISYPKVFLYTASNSSSNTYSTTSKEPRYYTYNGYHLKDDVLHTVYVLPFKDYIFEGRTTSDKLKEITDVTLYATGNISTKLAKASLIGSGVSLIYGLLQGWINEYGEQTLNAKDGDWAQFSIDYNSNTKYTSVETVKGNYVPSAKTGDVFVNSHGVNVYINDHRKETWNDVNKYVYTPNYTNPAPKAIASASGTMWIEEIEYRTSGGYLFHPNEV